MHSVVSGGRVRLHFERGRGLDGGQLSRGQYDGRSPGSVDDGDDNHHQPAPEEHHYLAGHGPQ